MFWKTKGDKSTGTPVWLRWAVIGVLAYMFFVSFQNRGTDEAKRKAAYNSNHGEVVRSTPGNSITIAGNRVTSRKQAANVQVGGDIEGRGATASCGEKADITISTLLPEGVTLSDAQKTQYFPAESATVRVGIHDENALWATGVTGMKTGGVREVLVPAHKVFGEDLSTEMALPRNAMMRYKITLTDLMPKHPEGTLPFRAMDSNIGRGAIALCGFQTTIHATVWNAKGEKLATTREPVTLTLGESKMSYGLDRGILGMKTGGERALTIPPAYLMKEGDYSKLVNPGELQQKLRSDDILIVDVKLISVEKP